MEIFGLKTRKCNKKCFFRHSDAFGVGWGGKGNLFTVLSLWTNWRLRGDSNVEGVLTFYASQISVHFHHVHDIAAATCVVHNLKECKRRGLLEG